uniref:Uncharacterized protein n=1 Tax=Oryza meridionalis TaxID=40149 RepID=A0A0E0DXG2_9ORYZ
MGRTRGARRWMERARPCRYCNHEEDLDSGGNDSSSPVTMGRSTTVKGTSSTSAGTWTTRRSAMVKEKSSSSPAPWGGAHVHCRAAPQVGG